MKKIFTLLIIALIGGLIFFTLYSKQYPSAPNFNLVDLNGKSINNNNLQGKVTLLNFWFPSCPGCASEMPKLIKTAHDYHNKNFQIISIAAPMDSLETVRNYAQSRQLPFQVAFDDNKAVNNLFVHTKLYPTSVLLNKHGQILKTFVGEPNFNELYQQIDEELKH